MDKQIFLIKNDRKICSSEINVVMKGVSWIVLLDSGACQYCKDFLDVEFPSENQETTFGFYSSKWTSFTD